MIKSSNNNDQLSRTMAFIDDLSKKGRNLADKYTILLIAPTKESMFDSLKGYRHQYLAQYYSESQIQNLKRAFESLGFGVNWFSSESDFLRWGSSEFSTGQVEGYLAYAIGECGLGPGRRALIPSFCQYFDIPFINSGATANCIARNKWLAYSILTKHGIRMPETWHYTHEHGWFHAKQPRLGQTVILKPNFESMCIGIDEESLFIWEDKKEEMVKSMSSQFDGEVVLQEFISGYEIGVPLISSSNQIRVVGYVGYAHRNLQGKIWDKPRTYRDENLSDLVENYEVDFLKSSNRSEIDQMTQRTAQLLMLRGFARIDFRVDSDGLAYVFDTNESPPPIIESSLGYLLRSRGYDQMDMLSMYAALGLSDVEAD